MAAAALRGVLQGRSAISRVSVCQECQRQCVKSISASDDGRRNALMRLHSRGALRLQQTWGTLPGTQARNGAGKGCLGDFSRKVKEVQCTTTRSTRCFFKAAGAAPGTVD